MFKRLFSNRTTTLTVIVFAIAFVICGIAWLRFFTVAAINPSPVRYVNFVTESGRQQPFQQECVGPAFIDADAAWRYCAYTGPSAIMPVSTIPDEWGLVRFDLAAGQALMRWPLPEAPDAQILALAPAPDGDLAVAWGSPKLSAIYHITANGGVEALGIPPDVDAITGLMWVESGLELLTQTQFDAAQNEFVVWTHDRAGGEWYEARTITLPPCGNDDLLCVFQMARYGERGWGFINASLPTPIDDPAAVQIDFSEIDETHRTIRVGAVDLSDLDPSQYTIDDAGEVTRLKPLFDQSPANLINWTMDAAPLIFPNDFARVLEAPSPDASFYFSNYEIVDDHLRWIPGLRYPNFSWYMGEWITLEAGDDGLQLAHYMDPATSESGSALTKNDSFIKQGSQTCVLPASDGGFWILGPNGAYVKADDTMSRADSLTLVERIQRSFENFGSLESVQDDTFYRQQRALEMAAFPLMLLLLPTGYLLVVFVRQTRPNTRIWMTLLLQVSALYIILATIFFWWFWEMTDHF